MYFIQMIIVYVNMIEYEIIIIITILLKYWNQLPFI